MTNLVTQPGPFIGLVLILGSLLCLGTFPTVLRLCTAYTGANIGQTRKRKQEKHVLTPKERIGQARHPCHVYLDFTVSYVLLTSLVFPGMEYIFSNAHAKNSLTDKAGSILSMYFNSISLASFQRNLPLIGLVCLAGSLLAMGNLSQQWSTAAFHAPLTTVLAIQASLCVMVGTYWNYTLQPSRTSRPNLLMVGVLMFLIAIFCSLCAQTYYKREQALRSNSLSEEGPYQHEADEDATESDSEGDEASSAVDVMSRTDSLGLSMHEVATQSPLMGTKNKEEKLPKYGSFHEIRRNSDGPCEQTNDECTPMSTGERQAIRTEVHDLESKGSEFREVKYDIDVEATEIADNMNNSNKIGILVAMLGGLAFGFFSPMFNISVNDPFQWTTIIDDNNEGNGGLSVSVANIWFSIGFAITSFTSNAYLMTFPPTLGRSPRSPLVQPSSLREYVSLSKESLQCRGLSYLAGALCALTNVLQFEGGALAGFAAADMTKAFPLVATIWDIFVFGEFQNASRQVVIFLVFMYISYTLGMMCLAGSIAV